MRFFIYVISTSGNVNTHLRFLIHLQYINLSFDWVTLKICHCMDKKHNKLTSTRFYPYNYPEMIAFNMLGNLILETQLCKRNISLIIITRCIYIEYFHHLFSQNLYTSSGCYELHKVTTKVNSFERTLYLKKDTLIVAVRNL